MVKLDVAFFRESFHRGVRKLCVFYQRVFTMRKSKIVNEPSVRVHASFSVVGVSVNNSEKVITVDNISI